jgi:FAD/FMN-containing dehydrogenase
LRLQPFINDVESFVLIDSASTARRCSRTENAGLFRLAIGGYGLFGIIASVQLRLARRQNYAAWWKLFLPTIWRRLFKNALTPGFSTAIFSL